MQIASSSTPIQLQDVCRSLLEEQTNIMVAADKINMMYADPNSEWSLATLARIVTMLIRGTSTNPNMDIKASLEGMNPNVLSIEELLAVRKKSM